MKNSNKQNFKNKKSIEPQTIQRETTPITETKSNYKWVWYVLAGILISTFIIYFNAIKLNILHSWDDPFYVRYNQDIRELSWANIKIFFTKYYVGNYQPLSMLSYAIDYKIGGGLTSVFHFSNVLYHLINTFLVFVLFRKICPQNAIIALITTAFFAIHPMHVESVAWLSERKDVLYSLFFLLALIMYTNYLRLHKIRYLLLTAFFFILSCLSKSAAVVLPLVMILFDYYLKRKFTWKTVAEKVPFFLFSVMIGMGALVSQGDTAAIKEMAPIMTNLEHISIVFFSFVSYIFKFFIPYKLSIIYPYPVGIGSVLPVAYYLSIIGVILIFYFVWYSRKWGNDFIFGFLFFIITIILVLQIVPVGGAIMADRYTYIPYLGLGFIVAKIYERLSLIENSKINYKKYSIIVLFIGFIVFSVSTFKRVKIWEDEYTMFTDVINKYPNSIIAYLGRGAYYMDYQKIYTNSKTSKEDYQNAINDFNNALNFPLKPEYKIRIHYNLGIAKSALDDYVGAINEYDKTIELDSLNGNSYINRGICYISYFVKNIYANDSVMRNFYLKKAITDFDIALQKCELSKEDSTKAYCNLGEAKIRMSNFKGAVNDLNIGIQMDSIVAGSNAFILRALANYHLSNFELALADYNKVIELNPRDSITIIKRNIVKSIVENR